MGEIQYQLMTADPPVVTCAMEDDDSELVTLKLLGQRSSLIPTVPAYHPNGSHSVNGGAPVTVSFHGNDYSEVPTPKNTGAAVKESVADTLDYSVYSDQRRRKWKCRHCNWTDHSNYGFGNRRSWKCRHCNWNSSNPSRLVNHEITGPESVDGGKNGFQFKGLNQQQHGRLSASSLTSPNGSWDQQPTVRWSYRNGGWEAMEQTKEGVTQLGVESVIEKLELYCPDCSSCITKRVILNTRKQNTPNGHRKPEEVENKYEAATNCPKSDAESSRPPLEQEKDIVGGFPDSSFRPAVNEGEPDLFRCFSCFRFFIPQELQVDDPVPATSTVPLLEPATEGLVQVPRVTILANQTHMAEQRGGSGGGESYKWEILRSVVFGGLIESITSLGVVTSAAGAGAGTLNVLVMGLANLIGGLVIITCNLLDLRHDSSRNEQEEDRYQKTLGKRENFAIHFTTAVLAFLVCGLLPTVTYGFTFQTESGNINTEEKLIAAGGVSLVCIILLAIGKAHIQKKQQQQQQLKGGYAGTVIYFFSIWMATSGTCYLVGDLIKKLIITTPM